MIKIYRAVLTAISSLFLCCAAGAQTYTYTYNPSGDRTYKSGTGPEETAGRSAAAVSASGQGPAQARTSVPAPRTLSTGSTVAGVDLSCDVGRIPVSSSVTPTGGRTYSIAIPTAAGCRLAPQIALTYNSQGGEGIAGYGWQLSGTSAITVRNRNTYYDGITDASLYTDNDAAYALDGMPLVQDSLASVCWFNYSTPVGHILVQKHTMSYGNVTYFTALNPDGSTSIYGNQSAISPVAVYPLTRITDADGNVINFSYIQPQGTSSYYLDVITYGRQQENSIEFEYELREDYPDSSFFSGRLMKSCYLLKRIVSSSNGEIISCDSLTHTKKFGTYVLDRISRSRSQGSARFNPVEFIYGNGQSPTTDVLVKTNVTIAPTQFSADSALIMDRGKLLPDEWRDGVIILPHYDNYTKIGGNVHNSLYGSAYPDTARIYVAPVAGDPASSRYIAVGEGFQCVNAIDINGDGRDEIVRANLVADSSEGMTYVNFHVGKYDANRTYTESGFGVPLNGVHQEGSYISPKHYLIRYGDFTGEGKIKAMLVDADPYDEGKVAVIVDLSDHSTDLFNIFDPYTDSTSLLCYDIDSDGCTEICRATSNNLEVYHFNGDSLYRRRIVSGMNNQIMSRCLTYGDINGDGYMDVISTPADSVGIVCHCFSGSRFTERMAISSMSVQNNDRFFLIDVNRDGLPELVRQRNKQLLAYLNERDCRYTPFIASRIISKTFSNKIQIIPCNLVSYNNSSSLIVFESGKVDCYKDNIDRSALRLLTSMSDSYGITQTNEYRNIAEPVTGDITYGTDPSRTYTTADGYCRMTLPLNVLSRTRTTVPGSTMVTDSTHFMYRDLVVHQRGLGLRGFGSMTQVCSTLGQPEYTVTTFDPENSGVVTHLTRRTGSPTADPTFDAQYRYSRIYRQWSKHTPRLASSTEEDYLAGICRDASYGYDNLDFVTSTTVALTPTGERSSSRNNDGSYACTETLTTYDHLIQPSTTSPKLLLGRVTQSVTARGNDPESGEMPYMEKTVTTYVSGKARPETVKQYVGWNGQFTLLRETHYGYDTYGNVTSQQSASYGSTTFVGESCTYDSSGRFITSKTDVLGNTTTYSGFDAFGNPSSVTDPRGNTMAYTYDTWGRPATVTRPDGSTEQTSYAWCSGSDGRLYKVTVSGNTIPTAVTYYGAADNVLASEQTRFDNSTVRVSRRYYTTGELAGEALPTKSAYIPSSSWSTISYDIHGRRVALTEASGSETTWDYDGLTTTTTQDGVWRTVVSGVDGNILSATDEGDTVTYSYREDGSPTSITAPGNATTTFAYDAYGRRSSMTDPSAGTRTDAWSNLSDGATLHTQTSAKGQVRTYANRNGQVTRVERTASAGYTGAFNTDYTYDVYGNLRTVTSSNGTSSSYTYDNLGRQATATETVTGGRSLTKTFTYDNLGRPASTRYRADTGLDRTETYGYANGYNTSISVGTTTVWQLSSENNFGQPTQATTGTVTRTYSYDTWGLPTGRTMGSVMSFSYAYDHGTGNMLSRTDEKRSITETFTYDDLNRLTGINDSQSGLRTISYADNGNITSITGNGSFSYTASGKPYQLTSAASASGGIPQYEQTVKYTSYDRPAQIYGPGYDITMTYGADGARMKCLTDMGEEETETRTCYYLGGVYECDVTGGEDPEPEKNGVGTSITERLYLGGDAYSAPMVLVRNGSGNGTLYNIGRDVQGSITHIASTSGTLVAEYSYDPWGRLRNPATHALYAPDSEPELMLGRGYTGHEHLKEAGLINMNARLYDPYLGRFLSPDPYVQDATSSQGFNRYSYCLNNPLRYTDESGEFLTWYIGNGGFSIGMNFSPIGVPLGFGVNIGWGNGWSVGVYGEVGVRVGGTGLGSGLTLYNSVDYGFKTNSWISSTGVSAYGSIGLINIGINGSYSYNMNDGSGGFGWNANAGINFGNDAFGIASSVGYGSEGWTYGVGGYYNPNAWDYNPTYEPEKWNDGGCIYVDQYGNIVDYDPTKQVTNNCYSYALDDIDNGNVCGLQPGYVNGQAPQSLNDITFDYILNAAVSDGRIKVPNFFNKLGFGKQGYYSVYLVIDEGSDYHWYRQDKGGKWSHKQGTTEVKNAGRRIGTPFAKYGNYKSGGILLWVKR